ncbi:MAG: hypothetical protein JWO63_993, partial [Frankiales bacterium]|nr:hypothetical protein [Frankiales bacterium]
AEWLLMAESLRSSGWRVVPVIAGVDLAELWPRLLANPRVGR